MCVSGNEIEFSIIIIFKLGVFKLLIFDFKINKNKDIVDKLELVLMSVEVMVDGKGKLFWVFKFF